MGGELGQWSEWAHEGELDWELSRQAAHRGVQRWVEDLNSLLASEPALHQRDFDPAGFSWVDVGDSARSLVSFLRFDEVGRPLLIVANFTPQLWPRCRFGVPVKGRWKTLLNSDAPRYGGSGARPGRLSAKARPEHGYEFSLELDVPPFGVVFAAPVS